MNYGWLTESALLPKKKKLISSEGQSSIFALESIVGKKK